MLWRSRWYSLSPSDPTREGQVRRTLGWWLYGTMSLEAGVSQYLFCEQVSTSRNICFATRDCDRSRWIRLGGDRSQSVVYAIRAIRAGEVDHSRSSESLSQQLRCYNAVC